MMQEEDGNYGTTTTRFNVDNDCRARRDRDRDSFSACILAVLCTLLLCPCCPWCLLVGKVGEKKKKETHNDGIICFGPLGNASLQDCPGTGKQQHQSHWGIKNSLGTIKPIQMSYSSWAHTHMILIIMMVVVANQNLNALPLFLN